MTRAGPGDLFWLDCTAGAVAGVATLTLSGWLGALYGLPEAVPVGMGAVNLAYASVSFTLARRAVRPMRWIVALVVANATWAMLCLGAAVAVVGTATGWGVAHFVAEGLFVGGLAAAEWRVRGRLVTR